jgi:hypothetical protein
MLRYEASAADEIDTSCLSMTANLMLLLIKKDKYLLAPHQEQTFRL